MSAVMLTPARAVDIKSIVWLDNVTIPKGPLSEMVSFLYWCVISKVCKSGFQTIEPKNCCLERS